MATLLNQATDSWSFDKLIQPLSNPSQLEELLSYLNGKHKSYQHDHIDPVALSRILMAIKFVGSKKKLLHTLKPCIDELICLCHSILNALKNENKLSKSSPWLWLDTILSFMNDKKTPFPWIDIDRDLSSDLCALFDDCELEQLPNFLFPEWCFATKNGIQTFAHNTDHNHNNNSKDITPKSRTLSNVSFLSFPRPNPPQIRPIQSPSSMGMNTNTRKRQKTSLSSYASIGANPSAFNETDRKRKFSAINDKLNKMMNKKNGQKNTVRLLSIQQKRQMREDSDRREQERRLQMEQIKKEKERLKKLEKEKKEREDKEKQQLSLMDNINALDNGDFNDDFDSFMNDLSEPKKEEEKESKKNEEDGLMALDVPQNEENEKKKKDELKWIEMGIPKQLHKFTWLHSNCNELTQENRQKIVEFLTGKYTKEGMEKEDVLLNRSIDLEKGVTKDGIFRMFFDTKKWKKNCIVEKSKEEENGMICRCQRIDTTHFSIKLIFKSFAMCFD
eukprot:758212_1